MYRSEPIRWKRVRVQVPEDHSARRLLSTPALTSALSTAPVTAELEVADLQSLPTARDRAVFLLRKAAEVEHALLIQYLYAALSLGPPFGAGAPANAPALVTGWRKVILGIAHEEMGHLMTVQNLRLLLGAPVSLERDDFPIEQGLYPFPFELQPLTQESLAKYVAAEMPEIAAPDDELKDIIRIATGDAGGVPVNRVGVLYAQLVAIFLRPEDIPSLAASADPWEAWVALVHRAAEAAAPPLHLEDGDFKTGTEPFHARLQDWGAEKTVHVQVTGSRDDAVAALREIMIQGEGPPSHQRQAAR